MLKKSLHAPGALWLRSVSLVVKNVTRGALAGILAFDRSSHSWKTTMTLSTAYAP